MIKVSFIIKSHLRHDDSALIGGASKNPYRLVQYLVRAVSVPQVIYFDGDHSGAESYVATRYAAGPLKLYAKTLFQNIVSAAAVWRAFAGSDVVQCHHPHYGLAAALFRRVAFRKRKFVVKAHGTAVPELAANRYRGVKGAILRFNARLHLWHDRFVLSCADAVLCSSEFQRQEMISLYRIRATPIFCIYNGYDSRYVERAPASPTHERARAGHFVFCGRVVPKKGIAYAIALFQELTRSRPDARLTLVLGRRREIEDGDTYQQIQRAAAADPRIVIAHDLTESQLYSLFASASVGLVPSQNYESIPTVVIEMLAAGLPAFATYQWGIPEILPERFGLSGDLTADAAKIRNCLEDQSYLAVVNELASRSRERFDYPELVRGYIDVYRQLAAGPQSVAVSHSR
jgi:glycosyltransferase involved in cell wall biosynthesis